MASVWGVRTRGCCGVIVGAPSLCWLSHCACPTVLMAADAGEACRVPMLGVNRLDNGQMTRPAGVFRDCLTPRLHLNWLMEIAGRERRTSARSRDQPSYNTCAMMFVGV